LAVSGVTHVEEQLVHSLVGALFSIRANPDGLKNQNDANHFEALAARAIHEAVPNHPEMVADPDFWICLAVLHFPETVEWRYGKPAGNRDAWRRRVSQCWRARQPATGSRRQS
jgi:hypothetical protein